MVYRQVTILLQNNLLLGDTYRIKGWMSNVSLKFKFSTIFEVISSHNFIFFRNFVAIGHFLWKFLSQHIKFCRKWPNFVEILSSNYLFCKYFVIKSHILGLFYCNISNFGNMLYQIPHFTCKGNILGYSIMSSGYFTWKCPNFGYCVEKEHILPQRSYFCTWVCTRLNDFTVYF